MVSLQNKLLAAAAGLLIAGAATSASAGPTTFTWSPSAVGLAGGNITNADNIIISDFANIKIDSTGGFIENGILTATQFQNSGTPLAPTGFGSTYSLYVTFNGTGTSGGIPTTVGQTVDGAFTSLNYTLWATPHSFPSVNVPSDGSMPTISSPNTGAFVLAFGSLASGQTHLALTNHGYSPTADLDLHFNACTGVDATTGCSSNTEGFFVDPSAKDLKLVVGNFSVTGTQATLTPGDPTTGSPSILSIKGGGGNLTLAVPEPGTLAVLGFSVLGLGFVSRRRRKAA